MPAPLRLLDVVASDDADRRRGIRIDDDACVSLGMAGRDPEQGRLTDVSPNGCCVETQATWAQPGRFVAITLAAGPSLESIVRWRRGTLAGLELLRPISAERPDWQALMS